MADTKISALAAVTSLASGDELVLARSGATKKIDADYLPGFVFAYTEFTSNVSVTGGSEGAANTVVTASAVTFDGSTVAMIEFFSSAVAPAAAGDCIIVLFEDGTAIGRLGYVFDTGTIAVPVLLRRKHTPASGSRTYSVRAHRNGGNAEVRAGSGGAGNQLPGYILITKY